MSAKKYYLPECKGCGYWRPVSWTNNKHGHCCHYLLDTGHMRQQSGGACLSRAEGKQPRRETPFDVPMGQRGM